MIHPIGALVVGTIAGVLSVIGYAYLSVKLLEVLLYLKLFVIFSALAIPVV